MEIALRVVTQFPVIIGVCVCSVSPTEHLLVMMQSGKAQKLVASDPRLTGLRLVPCDSLMEALREALGEAVERAPPSGLGKRGGSGGGENGGGDDGGDYEQRDEAPLEYRYMMPMMGADGQIEA